MSTHGPIVLVVWKDEGDFGFITAYTAEDLAHSKANSKSIGVPYDPDRVRPHGTVADAQALADEYGARLELQ
jgi:hypothetical protein